MISLTLAGCVEGRFIDESRLTPPRSPSSIDDGVAPVDPSVKHVFEDSFDTNPLTFWSVEAPERVQLVPAAGPDSSTALSVTLGSESAYVMNSDSARFEEGYLRFSFHPNGASIPSAGATWVPAAAIEIARFQGVDPWETLAALFVRQTAEGGYRGFVQWHSPAGSEYDFEQGEFDLRSDWQAITLGFKRDTGISVWLDGELVRHAQGVDHSHVAAHRIYLGQCGVPASNVPSGTFLFDEVVASVPYREVVWVDGAQGDDGHDGTSANTAVRSIQRGLDMASPGTTVRVQPGTYRETLRPATSGHADEPVALLADQGRGSVVVRGSVPAADLEWTPLPDNSIGLPAGAELSEIYVADLSSWGVVETPRFVVQLDDSDQVQARLPLAREPDWEVKTEWKYHEYWWAAEGGAVVAPCTPEPGDDHSCDEANRSATMLTDGADDTDPADIEPGNLTTLASLVGATLVVLDTVQGHSMFRRHIVQHDTQSGTITVDEDTMLLWYNALGWGSKYYVEDLPSLLDQPGEWWFDVATQQLYLWSPGGQNPATLALEISTQDSAMDLSGRSFVTVDGLTFEFFDGDVISLKNGEQELSTGNLLRNVDGRYGNIGISLSQNTLGADVFVVDGFVLEDSEIAHMDTKGLLSSYWWGVGLEPEDFTRPGIVNQVIRNSEFHHLAFRSDIDFPVGLAFLYADSTRFEGNHVHHVAHCGVNFWASVNTTDKEYGFAPEEIKTGEILVKDNIFEKACQLNADCGALKIGGSPPHKHVFRDFLITGNIFRNTYGWTYVSEKRGLRWAGTDSDRKGMGGFGLYTDYASGIHAYRNIAYNNAYVNYSMYGYWRNGDMVYYNNVAANSVYGFSMSQNTNDEVDAINAQVVNNIIINHEGRGVLLGDIDGQLDHIWFDHNLYFNNGWRTDEDGGLWKAGTMAVSGGSSTTNYYDSLEAIQADTPWEAHGQTGDPLLVDYDLSDHEMFDDSWPDLRITAESLLALDLGGELPESLQRLLTLFEIDDPQVNGVWDLGTHEWGVPEDVPAAAESSGGCDCAVAPGEHLASPVAGSLWGGLCLLLLGRRRRRP
ncbi:MAG: hypothetical protein DRI90_09055, partial [Deltaproteobacteria bacterium]